MADRKLRLVKAPVRVEVISRIVADESGAWVENWVGHRWEPRGVSPGMNTVFEAPAATDEDLERYRIPQDPWPRNYWPPHPWPTWARDDADPDPRHAVQQARLEMARAYADRFQLPFDPYFTIGHTSRNADHHLTVVVHGPGWTKSESSPQWTQATVTIAAGCWRGSFSASFEIESFSQFRAELEDLAEGKESRASFSSADPYLDLDFQRDSYNALRVSGTAYERPAVEPALDLAFEIEPLELPLLIAQLRGVEALLMEKD